ncbi:MAG: hypothetical protein Q7V43_26295 [Myxococcales bacterium]|nr:hypothetical protein [Myxococcales bacterium]
MLRPALAVVVALCLHSAAQAQTWKEPRYNPEIGSRWAVVSQSLSEEKRGDQTVSNRIDTRTEFSIDEKLADGFRISYVTREIRLSGSAPGNAIAEKAFGAVKDIVIRARTDAAGKPLVVENLDEVKSSMRSVVASMAQSFDSNPKVAALIRQLMEGFLIVDGEQAAATYMEDLPQLAAGQSTGLILGEVKREDESVPNPLGGGAIKSRLETRLVTFDAAAGKARYVRNRMLDPEALKGTIATLVEKLAAAAGNQKVTPEVLLAIKDVSLIMDNKVTIDVEGGMTRAVEDRSVMTASLMGRQMRKVERKAVTVTRMK